MSLGSQGSSSTVTCPSAGGPGEGADSGRSAAGGITPQVAGHVVQAQLVQLPGEGLAGGSIPAQALVVDIAHLLPDGHGVHAPGRAIDGHAAIARAGVLQVRPDAAAQVEGPQQAADAAAAVAQLLQVHVPAGDGVDYAEGGLQADRVGEGAHADRVLDVAPAVDLGRGLGHLDRVVDVDALRHVQLLGIDGHADLEGGVGADAGIEQLLPLEAVVVAARGGALKGEHAGLVGLAAQGLGSLLDALGQQVAKALAAGDHPQQAGGTIGIAPLQVEAELVLGEPALLAALHDPAAQPAPLVDVHAGLVDLGVEPGHGHGVGHAQGGAAAGPALVLGLVGQLALVRAAGQDVHHAVVHAAGRALVATVGEAVADGLGGELLQHLRPVGVEDVGGVVLLGQHAGDRTAAEAAQGTVLVQAAAPGAGLDAVGQPVGGGPHGGGVGQGKRLGAAHDSDGLDLLLAQHGPTPFLGGHVTIVAFDGGELDQVLAGHADAVDAHLVAGAAVAGHELVLELPGVQAQQVAGRQQLDVVVLDQQVGPVAGLTLEDDAIPAGELEAVAEEAVGLGRGGAVGQGAAGDHAHVGRAPGQAAGHDSGDQADAIVGVVPGDLGRDLVIQHAGAEAGAAQVFAGVGLVERLGPRPPGGQVDAQQLAGIAVEGPGRRGVGLEQAGSDHAAPPMAVGCLGWYKDSCPPPGTSSVAARPKPRSSIGVLKRTPLACSSCAVAWMSSHTRYSSCW